MKNVFATIALVSVSATAAFADVSDFHIDPSDAPACTAAGLVPYINDGIVDYEAAADARVAAGLGLTALAPAEEAIEDMYNTVMACGDVDLDVIYTVSDTIEAALVKPAMYQAAVAGVEASFADVEDKAAEFSYAADGFENALDNVTVLHSTIVEYPSGSYNDRMEEIERFMVLAADFDEAVFGARQAIEIARIAEIKAAVTNFLNVANARVSRGYDSGFSIEHSRGNADNNLKAAMNTLADALN